MTRTLKKMHDRAGQAFAAALISLVGASFAQSALAAGETSTNANDQYTWSAELVSFDQASKMATVKVRMDNPSGNKVVGDLMKGDPITVVWTGITWGAGVRDVVRGYQSNLPADALSLPAQFVAVDDKDNYISFEVLVPDTSAAKIQALKAGDWVTGTSSKHAADPKQAVAAIRGYNDVS
ncbi:MAG TPA: hypothetical protein VFV10_10965 [Gammaproteobacteria bacterium]|nr:hypothetical protein [Gammaproteobacteria bacterium]